MDENIFKNDAKSIVDLFFETKMFKDEITRDNMNEVENFIQFLLQSKFESYKKCVAITNSIKNIEKH